MALVDELISPGWRRGFPFLPVWQCHRVTLRKGNTAGGQAEADYCTGFRKRRPVIRPPSEFPAVTVPQQRDLRHRHAPATGHGPQPENVVESLQGVLYGSITWTLPRRASINMRRRSPCVFALFMVGIELRLSGRLD